MRSGGFIIFWATKRLVTSTLSRVTFRSRKRFQEKGMAQAKKQTGDVFTNGGTMVFNKHGKLYLTYNTEFGEYDMSVIAKAVEEARKS
mmetsp:Transcript_4016/g.7720  ORF Transcript_4016/g.7720 Transcript_4016/m.7720 type:complete len:88 (+) Transcript_4016:349-612(+)